METIQILAGAIFLVAVAVVITGVMDRSAGAAFGALAMVLAGVLAPREAFEAVDWNVIVLLISIWIIRI